MINVMIADDHQMFRQGITNLLATTEDIRLVGEAADGDAAIRVANEARPHVALVDLTMPGPGAKRVIAELSAQSPAVGTIVLTMHNEASLATQMLRAGARGFVVKDGAFQEVLDAVRTVAAGGSYVSPTLAAKLASGGSSDEEAPRLSGREQEVLEMVANGDTNRRIANRLGVSVKTVETHRASLMQKLGVRGAAELIRVAVERGLLSFPLR